MPSAGALDGGLHACGQEHRRSASCGPRPVSPPSPSSTDCRTGAGVRTSGSASQTPRVARPDALFQQDLRAAARRPEHDPPRAAASISRPRSPSLRQLPGGAHETWASGPRRGPLAGPEVAAGGDSTGAELEQVAASMDARGVPAEWCPGEATGSPCLTAAAALHEVHAGPDVPAVRPDERHAQGPAADMRHHVPVKTDVGSREGVDTSGGHQAAVVAEERQGVWGDGDGGRESGIRAVLRCPGMPAVHMTAPAGLPAHLLPHVMQCSDVRVLPARVVAGAPSDQPGSATASGAGEPGSPSARVAPVWISGDVAGGGAGVRPVGRAMHGAHDAHMHATAAGGRAAETQVCDAAPPLPPQPSASHPSTAPFPYAAAAEVPAAGQPARHNGNQPSLSAGSCAGMLEGAVQGAACSAPAPAPATVKRDHSGPRDASSAGRSYHSSPAHPHDRHASQQHGHNHLKAVEACVPEGAAHASAKPREAAMRDAGAGNSGSGPSPACGSAGDRCSVASGHGQSRTPVVAQPSGGDGGLGPAAPGPAALPQCAGLDTASLGYSAHQARSVGAHQTNPVNSPPFPGSGFNRGPPAADGEGQLWVGGGTRQQRDVAAYSGTSLQHPTQASPREPPQCAVIASAEDAREASFSGIHAVAAGGSVDLDPHSVHSMEPQATGLAVEDDGLGASRGGSAGRSRRCRVGGAVEGRGGDARRCDAGGCDAGRDSGRRALRPGERARRGDALSPSGAGVNMPGCFEEEEEFTDGDRGAPWLAVTLPGCVKAALLTDCVAAAPTTSMRFSGRAVARSRCARAPPCAEVRDYACIQHMEWFPPHVPTPGLASHGGRVCMPQCADLAGSPRGSRCYMLIA